MNSDESPHLQKQKQEFFTRQGKLIQNDFLLLLFLLLGFAAFAILFLIAGVLCWVGFNPWIVVISCVSIFVGVCFLFRTLYNNMKVKYAVSE